MNAFIHPRCTNMYIQACMHVYIHNIHVYPSINANMHPSMHAFTQGCVHYTYRYLHK